MLSNYLTVRMEENYKNLPLRNGVGIVVLNKNNKIFVAKRIDNPKIFGKCLKEVLMKVKIFSKQHIES